MSRNEFKLPTPDGEARAFSFQPAGEGPWPAVIFLMDAPAIRPALFDMAEHIAEEGFFVLMPDLFWRAGPYAPMNPRQVMGDPALRKAVLEPLRNSTNAQLAMSDVGAALDWLTHRKEVTPGPVGIAGYCMGGGLALRAAGIYPDRIAAVGAFHAARVATDESDSPHLLAERIKATVYVGGADHDAGFPPEQADRLRDALTEAGVENVVEIYEGARHGYAPSDTAAYDPTAAERHWKALFPLLNRTLKRAR